jgi:CDP-diacylglycerol--glycerol-3-phosphate 3-phosphatidyltransferase
MTPVMRRHLPNQITMARLVLAGVFFVVLNLYRYPKSNPAILWTAMGLFIVASLTDILDGYLARKWKVESTFGRIMDPFVDKVLVIGTLIYLAGARFVDPQAVEAGSPFTMISGIYPWMVAVMLARELLVTGIRGELEGRGIKFGANVWGKLKTLLQSVGIPFILGIVALNPRLPGREWMTYVREGFAYGMTLATLLSGIPYITGAIRQLRGPGKPPVAPGS